MRLPDTPHLAAYAWRSGWYVRARFGEIEVNAQLDSGAWSTLIPKKLAERLGCERVGIEGVRGVVGPRKAMPVFSGPALQGVALVGLPPTRLTVNFAQMRSTDLDHLLLGYDFLQQFITLFTRDDMWLYFRTDAGAASASVPERRVAAAAEAQ